MAFVSRPLHEQPTGEGPSDSDPVTGDRSGWPGSAFLRGRGLALGQVSVRRDLALPPDAELVAALDVATAGPASGYRIITWQGRTDPDHRDRMAVLMSRMSTDAPLDDLDYEPEVWDAGRVDEFETSWLARGTRLELAVLGAAMAADVPGARAARRVVTWNAVSNPYMIAVNEALGYRPAAVEETWQGKL